MQRVIAGYESLEQAQQAVRSLEPFLSIQDVIIADKHHRTWRRLHPERADTSSTRPFLVLMTGEPGVIARARQLLRPRRANASHDD
jgi:hypothetical protein